MLTRLCERHETAVFALHDIPLALSQTDRVIVLDEGRIVLDAPARDLPPPTSCRGTGAEVATRPPPATVRLPRGEPPVPALRAREPRSRRPRRHRARPLGGAAPAAGRARAAGPPVRRGQEHRLDGRLRGPRRRARRERGLVLASRSRAPRTVRLVCAFLRSVHELFWALLLLQVTGLSATTGILAIALPYTGIFAKVFSEMIEEADLAAVRVLPTGTGALSAFLYARLPELGRAVQDLHALPARMRPALDPGARLHRPADDGLPPRIRLPAGPLRRGRRAARSSSTCSSARAACGRAPRPSRPARRAACWSCPRRSGAARSARISSKHL